METLDKGTSHDPAVNEQDGRCHRTTQNSVRLKTYGLFTPGLSHVIVLDRG